MSKKVVHILWEMYSDRDYDVGPFYFCSEECRNAWTERQSPKNRATFTRNDIEVANCPENEFYGCDWCNGKNRR